MSKNNSPRSWVAHLRHELSNFINIIINYSELILESLEEPETEEKEDSIRDIKQILTIAREILASSQKTLAADNADLNETISSEIGKELRRQVETPALRAIALCEKQSSLASADLKPDLAKILQGLRLLLDTVDDLVEGRFEQQIHQLDGKTSDGRSDSIALAPPPAVIFSENLEDKINSDGRGDRQSHILVVDDHENNRDLLCRHLQEQDYRVEVAVNGRQALQMVQTRQYDLILLDVLMPEMNGYQVLQWLRESQWRTIPTIMISALDELDSVVKCIEMGAEDYLPKPFNPTLLRARIGACLEKKRLRDREALYANELAKANREITVLNERLKAENLRLSAEVEITRQLQQMILPKEEELSQIKELDIAGYMQPADEVGGDYYDVLQHKGRIKIGIGDVTGHGLESGVLTIMLQTAVRTLMENEQTNPIEFLETINRTIYKNVRRMNSEKNLTLSLVDYQEGILNLSGQHEDMIVVRACGELERISTIDLGFPIGLEESIIDFVTQTQVKLEPGDVAVLYTDGITEAENESGVQYGIERLCEALRQNWQKSASEIREVVIEDVRQFIGNQKVYDDITLLILKQRSPEQNHK